MAEQYQNLAVSTITGTMDASTNPFTLVVATGTGSLFPATTNGPFRITVSDQTGTNAEVMLVTSRSTDTMTAQRGTAIASFAAGEVPVPTLTTHSAGSIISHNLTAGAMNQIRLDIASTNGFIQSVTPPVPGNFSNINFNTGSGVVTTIATNTSIPTSITLCQNDPNATFELAALAKSPINAAFTITAGFTAFAVAGGALTGLWLTDGSANNLFFAVNAGGSVSLEVQVYSNYSGSFVTNAFTVSNAIAAYGPLVWLRIQETASARKYSVSSDGINFFQVFTESNTAHFTTVQYGFGIDNRAAGLSVITCYSFTETTP